MGLNVFKWLYELGVHNERQRIASYLQNARQDRQDDAYLLEKELRMKPASTKVTNERKHKLAVDQEIIDIIAGLFRSEDVYVRGKSVSVMFPEGEEK